MGWGSGGVHGSYYPYFWTQEQYYPWQSEEAAPTCTVEVNGKSYEGEYVWTDVEGFNTYELHFYHTQYGGFSLRADTGEVAEWYSYRTDDTPGMVPREELESMAQDFAASLIDTSLYDMDVIRSDSHHMAFAFRHKRLEWEHAPRLLIQFSTHGELLEFSNDMAGELEASLASYGDAELDALLTRLTSEESRSLAREKLEEIYPERTNESWREPYLIVLEDGELGIIYEGEVRFVRARDAYGNITLEGGSGFSILVREAKVTP